MTSPTHPVDAAHSVAGRLTTEDPAHVVSNGIQDAPLALGGDASHMRREHDLGQALKPAVHGRFERTNVQSSTRQVPTLEGVDEGVFLDDLTAPDVDKDRPRLQRTCPLV